MLQIIGIHKTYKIAMQLTRYSRKLFYQLEEIDNC